MEIILATITLLTIVSLVVVVGTRGKPLQAVSQFRAFAAGVRENRVQIGFLTVLAILVSALVYYYFIFPDVGAGPLQPIPFSHRLHAGHKDIDCRFCHSYVDRSHHPGLPPVDKCLYCHRHIITKHPEILKEHQYFDTGTPTPWKKVFYVPEHVLFNHERHIKKNIQCESCHGDVAATDRLKNHEFKMGFCIQCHREKNVNIGCWLSCHN